MSILSFILILMLGAGLGYRLPALLQRWRKHSYRRKFKPLLLREYVPEAGEEKSSSDIP